MAPPGGNWFSQPVVQKTLTSNGSSPMGFEYVGLNEKGEGKKFFENFWF